MAGKSGKQIGQENVEALRRYLASTESLPARNGKIDRSAIAMACQFDRGVLYNNPACCAMLEQAIKEKGLKGIEPRDGVDSADRNRVRLEKRVHDLEQVCAAQKAEIFELRRKLAGKTLADDHTIETGRRVKL